MMWLAALMVGVASGACGIGTAKLNELERVKSGALQVVLLSERDALRHGQDSFVIEFRTDPGGTLTDVGTVKATASMPMPGMPMFGGIDVRGADVPGRYAATGEFSMAGRWRLVVEWDGPAGRGSVSFSTSVQ
jgi:hypothetical protein